MRYTTGLMLAAVAVFGCRPGNEPAAEQDAALEVSSPELLDRASISSDQARAVALERSGGGTIVEAELEEERDRLLYSFEVRQADGNILELDVDAMTGELVDDTDHVEDPDAEDDDTGHDDDEDGRGP
jgi:hypothetical protein